MSAIPLDSATFNGTRGTLIDPATLRIQRHLPGTIERVWAYLADSTLRRQWLAAGAMPIEPGASFELVWRNDELSASAAERPPEFPAEQRATCTILEMLEPRRLRFDWTGVGEVCFELESTADGVLLTVTHRGLRGVDMIRDVSAGWHVHLAILLARLAATQPPSMWSEWLKLRAQYSASADAA